MTTATDERRVTTAEIADRLGMHWTHVSRWATDWHGPVGSGNRRHLTIIDLYVARAWREITGRAGCQRSSVSYLMAAAETAIRSEPRRWLLLAGPHATTHDDAETAALAWTESNQPAGRLIDLWSVPA